jgi:hypothetical protein
MMEFDEVKDAHKMQLHPVSHVLTLNFRGLVQVCELAYDKYDIFRSMD